MFFFCKSSIVKQLTSAYVLHLYYNPLWVPFIPLLRTLYVFGLSVCLCRALVATSLIWIILTSENCLGRWTVGISSVVYCLKLFYSFFLLVCSYV